MWLSPIHLFKHKSQKIEVMRKFTNLHAFPSSAFSCSKKFQFIRLTRCMLTLRWSAIPGKGPRLKAGRAVSPAAKPCHPTIPLILWSSAESTSRLQVKLDAPYTHTGTNTMWSSMCDLHSISCIYKINRGVVSLFSIPRISVPWLSAFVKLVGLSPP